MSDTSSPIHGLIPYFVATFVWLMTLGWFASLLKILPPLRAPLVIALAICPLLTAA